MREIKFRAWHKNRKTFLDFDWAVDKLGRTFSILDKCMYDEFTNEIELMQYTGLDDVNGNPIYEGDIVKAYRTCKSDLITFANGSFGIDPDYWHSFESFTNFYGKCEVIGNKFQNPELLEVTDNEQ